MPKSVAIALVAVFASLISEGAISADYYVSKTGSDNNSGTVSQPFRTPQKAADVANPGDTVFIENGTYADEDNDGRIIDMRRSGTAGQFITFQSRPGHTAILADATAAFGIIGVAADYIRVKGIEFDTVWSVCIALENIGSDGSDNWEILDNVLHDCGATSTSCGDIYGRAGIFTDGRTKNALIDSNTIYSVGRIRNTSCDSLPEADNHQYRHDHGIYAKGKYITIQNNVIYDMYAGYGIKIDGFTTSSGNISTGEFSHVIINNTFGPNTNPNPYSSKSGAGIRPVNSTPSSYDPRWLVKNNIFLNQSDSYSAVLITDNSWSNFATDNHCENNLSEAASGLLSTCSEHIPGVAANVAVSDNSTGIVDVGLVGSNNYRLTATSPAIAHGDPVLAPSFDKDGIARNSTGSIDAGAYTYSSAILPNPPSGLEVVSSN